MFQHTATRRRLGLASSLGRLIYLFQHTAARRRLDLWRGSRGLRVHCFNTQPPEGGCSFHVYKVVNLLFQHTAARRRLSIKSRISLLKTMFQHTAARRRLADGRTILDKELKVSTHSRPKAAESKRRPRPSSKKFQHTAARRRLLAPELMKKWLKSFNTQPPEGGCFVCYFYRYYDDVSTHSRPKAAEPLLKALFHQVSQPRFR